MKDTEGTFDEKFNQLVKEQKTEKIPEVYSHQEVIVEEAFIKTVADRSKEEPAVETVKVISKESLKHEPEVSSSITKDSVPEKDIVKTTVTTTSFDDGSHSIITTKTTERRSFIIDDDDADAVHEKIVVEKRTDSAVTSPSDQSVRNDMLQKLGEELGKLDDKLQEKFKEKRRTEQLDEGNETHLNKHINNTHDSLSYKLLM